MTSDSNDGDGVAGVGQQSLKDARHLAVRLLSSREHSRHELSLKLIKKGWAEDQVDQVLDWLNDHGLQCDLRYAQTYLRGRARKAYGPIRIRGELQERGVDRQVIDKAFASEPMDWLANAADWYERRYGQALCEDLNERARRQQALARRGFTTDVIRELVN